MPNWCSNYLKVSGDKDEVQKFHKRFSGKKEKNYSFYNFLKKDLVYMGALGNKTMEKLRSYLFDHKDILHDDNKLIKFLRKDQYEILNNVEVKKDDVLKTEPLLFKITDWYTYNIDRFGTKWDVSSDSMTYYKDEDVVEYYFDTAWSPPSNIVEIMAKKFPSLLFEMESNEDGAGFTYVLEICEEDDVNIENEYVGADRLMYYYYDKGVCESYSLHGDNRYSSLINYYSFANTGKEEDKNRHMLFTPDRKGRIKISFIEDDKTFKLKSDEVDEHTSSYFKIYFTEVDDEILISQYKLKETQFQTWSYINYDEMWDTGFNPNITVYSLDIKDHEELITKLKLEVVE